MSTRSRSTLSADTVKKKGKGVAGRVGKISDDQVQELVRERRESLLSERQAAVERVLDNHDNLVCLLLYLPERRSDELYRSEKRFIWRISPAYWPMILRYAQSSLRDRFIQLT